MRTGRVRTRGEFAALRQRGSRSRQRSVRVLHLPDGADDVRLAFAVSRHVGTAVVRNRLRRQLRAAFRDLGPVGGLYLITVQPSAVGQSYSDLRASLAQALDEVGGR
jgi:ribonuclease P protein component